MRQEPQSSQGDYYARGIKILQVKKCLVLQRHQKQALLQFRRGQRLDTVTLFSEPGRNSSVAVSRNSTIGLSCVTHWIRSSLCSSNRTDKVFPSPALPGGERIRDTQEKLVNLKKMTAWSVERDLTE